MGKILSQRYRASEAVLRALSALDDLPKAIKAVRELSYLINDESGSVADEVQKICPEVFELIIVHEHELKALHSRLYDEWEDERKVIDAEMGAS